MGGGASKKSRNGMPHLKLLGSTSIFSVLSKPALTLLAKACVEKEVALGDVLPAALFTLVVEGQVAVNVNVLELMPMQPAKALGAPELKGGAPGAGVPVSSSNGRVSPADKSRGARGNRNSVQLMMRVLSRSQYFTCAKRYAPTARRSPRAEVRKLPQSKKKEGNQSGGGGAAKSGGGRSPRQHGRSFDLADVCPDSAPDDPKTETAEGANATTATTLAVMAPNTRLLYLPTAAALKLSNSCDEVGQILYVSRCTISSPTAHNSHCNPHGNPQPFIIPPHRLRCPIHDARPTRRAHAQGAREARRERHGPLPAQHVRIHQSIGPPHTHPPRIMHGPKPRSPTSLTGLSALLTFVRSLAHPSLAPISRTLFRSHPLAGRSSTTRTLPRYCGAFPFCEPKGASWG